MTRRVHVVNTATALIQETWSLDVPDEMTDEMIAADWRDLLDHPEQFSATIIAATDKVLGEECDREFQEVYE